MNRTAKTNNVKHDAHKPKSPFGYMNHLLHRKDPSTTPPCDSDLQQANVFVDFFAGKIDKIRGYLDSQTGSDPVPEPVYIRICQICRG